MQVKPLTFYVNRWSVFSRATNNKRLLQKLKFSPVNVILRYKEADLNDTDAHLCENSGDNRQESMQNLHKETLKC